MLQVTVQRNKDRLITSWLLSCFLFAFENKNVPRERWEFVTDSDTGPHQGPHQGPHRVIFRCFRASAHGVRGSQPSVCEIETPNSWSCFGSKRRFCWKQRETCSCLEVWWMWSFFLKKKSQLFFFTFKFYRGGRAPCPPYISTAAPAEVSLDGLHWLWFLAVIIIKTIISWVMTHSGWYGELVQEVC